MKSKFVAALLSALVFPGVGQYYLGRKGRAWLFIAVAAVGGLLYLNHALAQANDLADQVLSGRVALDPAAIEAQIAKAPTPLSVSISGVVFVVSWVGSVLEALMVKPPMR